jgi:short subunit dehydrogenase-like uncharacterized protein
MAAQNPPTGRVVLFGATGYTGELAARAMVARGMRPVLAARRREAVEVLAGGLGGLEAITADVSEPASVRALVERGDVLVSTVGPFVRWGDAALDAAIDAGAHYVDSTGEPPFVRRVFEPAAAGAAAAGSLLLTAMGYDWLPGNLTGGLALREAGDAATAVRIGYFTKGGGLGGASGGTRASAMGALLEPGFHYRDGRIVTERGAKKVHSFDFGGREKPGISVGTSEAFSLPRAFPNLRDVEVYLGWFGGASRPMQAFSLLGAGVSKIPGVTDAMSAATGRFVKTSTGGPDAEARAATGSRFVAEALGASGEVLATVRTEGVNGYTFTGESLAWAAERIAAGDAQGVGALGPVEAFGLDALEAGVADCGISRTS